MARTHFNHRGLLFAAAIAGIRASGVETTAGWQSNDVRHAALDHVKPVSFLVKTWNRAEQSLRVLVFRIIVDLFGCSAFYNLTAVHDQYSVAHFSDNAQIMGNQDHRQIMLRLQFADQIKNLRLTIIKNVQKISELTIIRTILNLLLNMVQIPLSVEISRQIAPS